MNRYDHQNGYFNKPQMRFKFKAFVWAIVLFIAACLLYIRAAAHHRSMKWGTGCCTSFFCSRLALVMKSFISPVYHVFIGAWTPSSVDASLTCGPWVKIYTWPYTVYMILNTESCVSLPKLVACFNHMRNCLKYNAYSYTP